MRIYSRRTVALVIALAALVAARADSGTTAYDFLKVTPSSHVYGLGGHNITIIDDDINLP